MERSYSSAHGGASWADQWDYNPEPATFGSDKKRRGVLSASGNSKYKEKFSEGVEKTKSVASHGVRKVKQGTSSGIQWVKDKYHKTTHK
ncbi:hypothetical protein MLD38_031961 [Melastoma candidum]|uniref:Uncharacterized protein n=1 Tax=Melastoma candidum TaxID=119954 RepID=A0ACB9MSD5_9MYRT|nr:hypothetical protein MLD38_031961 [Melastoma candidum]